MKLDYQGYLSLPKLGVPGTIALAHMLLADKPQSLSEAAQRAAEQLRSSAESLRQAWVAKRPEVSGAVVKMLDAALDNAWGAFAKRLESAAELDAEPALAERARKLYERLFPTGLRFLTLPYREEWAESDKRLRLIDTEQLGASLDELCGRGFLAAVRAAQEQYGAALAITAPSAASTATESLLPLLRQVHGAVRGYALQLLALADAGQLDVEQAAKSLEPIQRVRREMGRRGAASANEPDESVLEQALPEV